MKLEIEQLREWMTAMKEFGVTEIRYEDGDTELWLKRELSAAPPHVERPSVAPAPVEEAPPAEPEADPEKVIKSPVVGVFYQSSVQDGPPLVNVGDEVAEGDVVGIIEAMKLMNEVLAPHSGSIKEILVTSGQKVEYGQPLMILA